jgi:hypothetical protein
MFLAQETGYGNAFLLKLWEKVNSIPKVRGDLAIAGFLSTERTSCSNEGGEINRLKCVKVG